MIFVDHRTGSVDLAPLLKTKSIITELEFGDVSFSGNNGDDVITIGIERKRIGDLISSVATGRLSAHQIPGMLKMYDVSYIIVEGLWKGDKMSGELLVSKDFGRTYRSIYKNNKRWTEAGVYAYLTTIETFVGVPFRLTRDARHTAKMIDILYGWYQGIQRHTSHLAIHTKAFRDADGKCSLIPTSIAHSTTLAGVNKEVRYLSAQLPHIDAKRSIVVAKKFQSPREMFEATVEDWTSIPGIGKATAEAVYKYLH